MEEGAVSRSGASMDDLKVLLLLVPQYPPAGSAAAAACTCVLSAPPFVAS